MARRITRAAVAILAAASLLTAGAWAGGALRPFAGGARARRSGLDPEKGRLALGDRLVASGQTMQLWAFTTHDPAARVIAFHADAFRRRGLLPLSFTGGQLGHVSVFDPADGLQRFVTALPRPGGETVVLLGAAHPRRIPQLLAGARSVRFPVPEGSRAFLGYEADDAGVRAELGQFVTQLAPREVREFYRTKLAAAGYREQETESDALLTLANAAGETVSIAVQALESDRGAAVFVSRISGAPR
jgi:hypothetical protein